MKRRQALERLGWGLSGGLLLPSLISSCGKPDPGPEINYSGTVAIIGAGAAGLYVADILRSKGINVKIFEARDQIGGRLRSLRNQSVSEYPAINYLASDFPIELGAETIIGSDSIFGKVFTAYNLPTVEYTTTDNQFVLDNVAKFATDWNSDPDFVAAKNFRNNIPNYSGSAQTVQQAIQGAGLSSRTYGMLNGQIGNLYGADNTSAGIVGISQGEKIRATDGKIIALKANPMQDAIISRFSETQALVQLNTPIVSINYSSGKTATLTAKNGTTYEADKVIVTVPLSILKNGLTFTPGLPGANAGALTKFGMGACVRCIIEFKKNFWGDAVGFILGSANCPEYFSMGLGRSQFNTTLSVTINGAKGAQYSAMGSSAVNAILADIDQLYAGQGTLFVRKDSTPDTNNIYILHDWTKTDYILGGYSYPLANAVNEDRKALGTPVDGMLFFAGEATDTTGQAGMVNGALASAERAAQEVISSITAA